MHRLLALSLLGLTLGCGSSNSQCDIDIGCFQGTFLSFHRAFTEPGRYRVQVEWEGKTASCEATLPPTNCPAAPPPDCGPINMQIALCGIPGEQATFSGLGLDVTAASIAIRISRDEAPLVSQTVTPEYQISHPAGPECGACKGADLKLNVPD